MTFKEQEQAREDPVVRLERENKHLREANLRLERESDDLAQELITSKIGLRADLDACEEKADAYFKEIQTLKRLFKETEESRTQIQNEAVKVCIPFHRVLSLVSFIYFVSLSQVKEMLQREVQRAEGESRRNQSIINDYKQICSKLGNRLEEEQSRAKEIWQRLQDTLSNCSSCSGLLDDLSALIASEQSSPIQIIGSTALDSKPRSPTSSVSPFESQVVMKNLKLAHPFASLSHFLFICFPPN